MSLPDPRDTHGDSDSMSIWYDEMVPATELIIAEVERQLRNARTYARSRLLLIAAGSRSAQLLK